jgi:hypothetical protein
MSIEFDYTLDRYHEDPTGHEVKTEIRLQVTAGFRDDLLDSLDMTGADDLTTDEDEELEQAAQDEYDRECQRRETNNQITAYERRLP